MTPATGASRRYDNAPQDPSRPISSVFVWIGLFTISWEKLANISVGSFNLKLSTIAFAVAFVLTLIDHLRRPFQIGVKQPLVPLAVAVSAVFAFMSLFAADKSAAAAQTVTVLLGALLPFGAVYMNIRTFGMAEKSLKALIAGGWFAALFGLYQLFAFYTGLPQGITYTAVTGGLGRISAFNYEAAYFADFLLIVIAAVFTRALVLGKRVKRFELVFFLAVLLLANSRATFFALPIFFVLAYFHWPRSSTRARVWPAVVAAAFLGLIIGIVRPSVFTGLFTRFVSVFNTHDTASNQPRLELYGATLRIARDHFLTGIGGGNLILYAPAYGLSTPVGATSNSVISNNVWLQALMDGGVLLLGIEIAIVVTVVVCFYRRTQPTARFLAAAYIALAIVAFMLTSIFFNPALWVTLALASALASRLEQPGADVSFGRLSISSLQAKSADEKPIA